MGKHALLLSGGVDRSHNYARYKNDMEWVYRVLVEDCDYKRENIKVFYASGQSLNYAGESISTSRADRTETVRYLEHMALVLNKEDSFTLVVSNHGGSVDGGCINLWGTVYLELELLVELLNRIKAQKYIVLGECYGGNILNWKVDNSCIITANEKGQVSYTNPAKMDYDELILHLFSYIHKEYPDGKAIPQGGNDLRDAYRFACMNDVLRPGSPMAQMYSVTEIPQMECDMIGKIQL